MKTRKKAIYADHLACYLFASRLINGRSVLELGCGEGYGAQMMSLFSSAYLGLDFSHRNIEIAKKKQMYCPSGFALLDLEKETLPAPPADLVVAFEVLEHIDNPESVLQQIVAQEQDFIFSVPHNDAHPWHKRVYESIEDVEKIVPKNTPVTWYSLRGGHIIEGAVREPQRYIGVSSGLVL